MATAPHATASDAAAPHAPLPDTYVPPSQRFESWDLVLATVAASNAAATLNYVLRATVDVLD